MENTVVTTYEELALAYKSKTPRIIIKGELIEDMKQLKKEQLSDEARLGADLGSSGLSLIIESIYLMIHRKLKGGNIEKEKLKDNVSILYDIKLCADNTIYLTLKSLNY